MKIFVFSALLVCSSICLAATYSKTMLVSVNVISSCSLNSINPSFESSSKILPGGIDIHCNKETFYTVSISSNTKNINDVNLQESSYNIYSDPLYHENITNKILNSHGICNSTNIGNCDTKIQAVEYKTYPQLSKNLTKLPSDEVFITVSY